MQLNDHLGSNFHILQRQSSLKYNITTDCTAPEKEEERLLWCVGWCLGGAYRRMKELIFRAIVIDDNQSSFCGALEWAVSRRWRVSEGMEGNDAMHPPNNLPRLMSGTCSSVQVKGVPRTTHWRSSFLRLFHSLRCLSLYLPIFALQGSSCVALCKV